MKPTLEVPPELQAADGSAVIAGLDPAILDPEVHVPAEVLAFEPVQPATKPVKAKAPARKKVA